MNVKLISALAAGLLSAAPAFADTVTLDFEGVVNEGGVQDFYNGGVDGGGNTGTNYGISFGLDAYGLSNGFNPDLLSNIPSGSSVLTAIGDSAAMNVTAGFLGQVSFAYSSMADVSVGIWSDVNGTGTLLDTILLSANAQGNGCSDATLCFWNTVTFDFNGLAKSLQFGTAQASAAFDNVTVAPVPLPAAAWLLLSALGGFGALTRRKAAA